MNNLIFGRSFINRMRFCLLFVGLLWSGGLVSRATTYYVATNGAGVDFQSWGTAASNIQDAISKATTEGDIVLVSNGVYETGGVTNWPSDTALTNRVAITNAITVMSANNNPANTIIKGRFDTGEPGATGTVTNGPAAVRCVYMMSSSSAKLIGFMLTNGATFGDWPVSNENHKGGGVYCPSTSPIISNCVIAGNSAHMYGGGAWYGTLYNCTIVGNSVSAGGGGGVYDSTLYNCTLTGNSSGGWGGGGEYVNLYNCLLTGNSAARGGGVYGGTLYNCTVVSNSSTSGSGGGGVYNSVLYNCIVYFNYHAGVRSNWWSTCSFTNSCTAPTATVWAAGNITDNPMFADTNTTNYRLAADSPCIDRGTNYSWMSDGSATSKDLDGRTRIRYGTVDMGAYERINEGTIYKLW